ncbi:acyltransferase family protein [Curtobacterium oceanosedimentum]|uniref:acyltransferase family protein n=1 Tax=Curtobacterium oceanosedimentum TaxID=465820 RepID=UPI003391116A
MPSINRSPRFISVQALRVLAALLVVCAHVPDYIEDRVGVTAPTIPTGQLGVAVFFSISGLVAVVTTQRGTGRSAVRFARRRLTRIVPLAWIVLTVKLLVGLIAPGTLQRFTPDAVYVVASYLFLPARGSDGAVQPLYTVMWTLTFELFFYAVVTAALLARRTPISVAAPVMVLLAVASVFRPDEWEPWQFYANPYVLLFVVGMSIGHVATRSADRVTTAWGVIALATWTGTGLASGTATGTMVLLPVSAVVLLLALWVERWLPQWIAPPAEVLGDASYALYLTHPLVAPITIAALAAVLPAGTPWQLFAVVAVVVAIVTSIVTWFGLDRPLVRALTRGRRGSAEIPRVRSDDTGAVAS